MRERIHQARDGLFQMLELAVEIGVVTAVFDDRASMGHGGAVPIEEDTDFRHGRAAGHMGGYMATCRAKAARGEPRVGARRSSMSTSNTVATEGSIARRTTDAQCLALVCGSIAAQFSNARTELIDPLPEADAM